MQPLIRDLTADDIFAVATIHVRAWQQAYAGIMPANYLNGLDIESRRQSWQKGYDTYKDDPRRGTLVALCAADTIAGFLSYGPARDEDRSDWTEIYAVNLLQEYWGQGMGRSLFTAARDRLWKSGSAQTYLWVLNDNTRALKAYGRWGGIVEQERSKIIEIGGATLTEKSVLFQLA